MNSEKNLKWLKGVLIFKILVIIFVWGLPQRRTPPVAILRITDRNGDIVYEYKPAEGTQVVRPEHAYLITSILSDNRARTPAFGANSALNLPFPAAVKTGTTNNLRDNWTIGYTPKYLAAVWVGNNDNTPMSYVASGVTGASPIWQQIMKYLLDKQPPNVFTPPMGMKKIQLCKRFWE